MRDDSINEIIMERATMLAEEHIDDYMETTKELCKSYFIQGVKHGYEVAHDMSLRTPIDDDPECDSTVLSIRTDTQSVKIQTMAVDITEILRGLFMPAICAIGFSESIVLDGMQKILKEEGRKKNGVQEVIEMAGNLPENDLNTVMLILHSHLKELREDREYDELKEAEDAQNSKKRKMPKKMKASPNHQTKS